MAYYPSSSTSPNEVNRPATPRTLLIYHTQCQDMIWSASGQQMNHTVPTADQISRSNSLSPNVQWCWQGLQLEHYGGGRGHGTGHVIRFERPGGRLLLLTEALNGIGDLRDAECSATLGDVSSKLSIRIAFPGAEPYTRQMTARRSTTRAEPIAMKVLARKIAEEMKKYIDREQEAGRPLKYRNMPVKLQHLALYGFENISGGSWVPLLKIWSVLDVRDVRSMGRLP